MTETRESYRPANGLEGADFMERWCARCIHDRAFRDAGTNAGAEDSCPIAAAAVAFDLDDPEYPAEWVYGEDGPECTAFAHDDREPHRCMRTPDLFQGAEA